MPDVAVAQAAGVFKKTCIPSLQLLCLLVSSPSLNLASEGIGVAIVSVAASSVAIGADLRPLRVATAAVTVALLEVGVALFDGCEAFDCSAGDFLDFSKGSWAEGRDIESFALDWLCGWSGGGQSGEDWEEEGDGELHFVNMEVLRYEFRWLERLSRGFLWYDLGGSLILTCLIEKKYQVYGQHWSLFIFIESPH